MLFMVTIFSFNGFTFLTFLRHGLVLIVSGKSTINVWDSNSMPTHIFTEQMHACNLPVGSFVLLWKLCQIRAVETLQTFSEPRVCGELWGERRYLCRLSFSSFKCEVDQCFGSVWTGTGVPRRHCTRLCRLPCSPFNPHQSNHTSVAFRRRVVVVKRLTDSW